MSVHCQFDDAMTALRRLRDAGHVAYFAGGCVRDRLLGLVPKDWDIATDAPPAQVRKLFARTQAVGAAFGVILVHVNASTIEVATFRTDGSYTDGRRPDRVSFSTLEEDARRRDFTINGLFWDPIDDRVIDFVDGRRDLESRTLRAIGSPEARFAEDYLRMLRAVRFAARFSLAIDDATRLAIEANHRSLIGISPERIGDELRTMLAPSTRSVAVRLLDELKLLGPILRFVDAPVDLPVDAGAVRPTLLDAMNDEPRVGFGLALAALVADWRASRSGTDPAAFLTADAAGQATRAMRTALRISNEESDALRVATSLEGLLAPELPRVATMKRFLAQQHAADAVALLRAVSKTDSTHAPRAAELLDRFASFPEASIAPPPLLTGDHLVALGHKPGPIFKRMLDAAYDAQLEDRVASHAEALAIALRLKP